MSSPAGPTFTRVGFCASNRKKIFGLLASLIVLVTIVTVCLYRASHPLLGEDTDYDYDDASPLSRNPTDVRLPTNLEPISYKLSLIPHLDPALNFTIKGTAQIDIICKETTDRIVLNIKNIGIHEGSVSVRRLEGDGNGKKNSEIGILRHVYDLRRDFYKVVLNESLLPGKSVRLSLDYDAVLSDQLVGFYRSSYVEKATNETR
jgi:hypothetical protein